MSELNTALGPRAVPGAGRRLHPAQEPGRPGANRDARTPHYAASTVKLSVLVAVLAEESTGRLDLSEELLIHDDFSSAAGGRFTLGRHDDRDDATWRLLTSTELEDAAEQLVARLSTITWEGWTRWHAS
jgi:beta-lactamase class A